MPRIDTIVVHDGPQGPTGPSGTNISVQPGAPASPVAGALWLDTDDTTPDTSLNWGNIAGTLSDQTDLQTALNSKTTLPSQTGNAGKVLTTDGTNPSWGTPTTGIPTGGTAGQTLAKQSATAGDVGWVDPPVMPLASGNYLTPATHGAGTSTFNTTQSIGANTLVGVPIRVPRALTVTQMVVEVTTAAVSGNARLGIYTWDSTPALVIEAGAVVTTATGNVATGTIAQALTPGWYFFVVAVDVAVTLRGFNGIYAPYLGFFGGTQGQGGRFVQTFTYAALPATLGALGWQSGMNGPQIGAKIA